MKNIQSKNRVYGTIGLVGLFLVGAITGYILNGSNHINHSIMTEEQCENLSSKMWNAINNNRYEDIATLNKVYSENCLDRDFKKPEPQPKVEEQKTPKATCEKIEYVLLAQLMCREEGTEHCMDDWAHISNAKIYANLSERGCPENSAKYKEKAAQELEIARALTDDNIEGRRDESVEIVETYKRLQMQAEAERMIEKAKKLTNPAIDFIIQLEKIIEE